MLHCCWNYPVQNKRLLCMVVFFVWHLNGIFQLRAQRKNLKLEVKCIFNICVHVQGCTDFLLIFLHKRCHFKNFYSTSVQNMLFIIFKDFYTAAQRIQELGKQTLIRLLKNFHQSSRGRKKKKKLRNS